MGCFEGFCPFKVQSSQLLLLPGALDRTSSTVSAPSAPPAVHSWFPLLSSSMDLSLLHSPRISEAAGQSTPGDFRWGPELTEQTFGLPQELQFSSKKLALATASPTTAILHVWCEKRQKMVIFFVLSKCFSSIHLEEKAADLDTSLV